MRQRAARVRDWLKRPRGGLFDFGEVVASIAHHRAQVSVGSPGLLGGRRRLGLLPAQLLVQREYVLDDVARHPGARPQVRQLEPGIDGVTLGFVESDLKLRPPAGRLAAHQLFGGHAKSAGQGVDLGQLRLATAVL